MKTDKTEADDLREDIARLERELEAGQDSHDALLKLHDIVERLYSQLPPKESPE